MLTAVASAPSGDAKGGGGACTIVLSGRILRRLFQRDHLVGRAAGPTLLILLIQRATSVKLKCHHPKT